MLLHVAASSATHTWPCNVDQFSQYSSSLFFFARFFFLFYYKFQFLCNSINKNTNTYEKDQVWTSIITNNKMSWFFTRGLYIRRRAARNEENTCLMLVYSRLLNCLRWENVCKKKLLNLLIAKKNVTVSVSNLVGLVTKDL